jgi:hypothetical protein
MSSDRFIDRVLGRVPRAPITDYTFMHWPHGDKPTHEGVGLLPVLGADPEKILARVFEVDHYLGNIGHVVECRAVADERFQRPEKLRFYQRVKIPLLGEVHHELVLERLGTIDGFEIAAWSMLEAETGALSSKRGIRSQYNEGAWLVKPGVVGYALSSAPRRDDVGFLKWKALTTGADVAASGVVRENIDGMSRWASRRS